MAGLTNPWLGIVGGVHIQASILVVETGQDAVI